MRLSPALLLLAACAHDAPVTTDDPYVASPRVSGTVIVTADEPPGDTFVLVYDAAEPPPPEGTGQPFTFSVVPASAYRTPGTGEQVYEAPFDMSLGGIPEGVEQVLVTALVDQDDDFYPLDPFSSVTAGATCGDLVGAHVSDLATGAFAPVAVAPNAHAAGISVLVARTSTLERPAFRFLEGAPIISLAEYDGVGLPPTFVLASTPVETVLPGDDGVPRPFLQIDDEGPCAARFAVTGFDDDDDGTIDPHPLLGPSFRDTAPRVVAQYLGPIDPQTGQVIPVDPEVDVQWSAELALSPTATWFDQIPVTSPGAPGPAIELRDRLEVAWVPGAQGVSPLTGEVRTLSASADLEQFKAELPRGAWSVTLINVAGQTWTVPNNLYLLDPAGPEGPLSSQRAALIITD